MVMIGYCYAIANCSTRICGEIFEIMRSTSQVWKPFKGSLNSIILTLLKDLCNNFWMSPPTGGRCRTGFLRAHGDTVKNSFFKKSKKKFFQHTPVLLGAIFHAPIFRFDNGPNFLQRKSEHNREESHTFTAIPVLCARAPICAEGNLGRYRSEK